MVLFAAILFVPATQAAEITIRAVVVKSARVSTQGKQVLVKTARAVAPDEVRVSVLPDEQRVVLTP